MTLDINYMLINATVDTVKILSHLFNSFKFNNIAKTMPTRPSRTHIIRSAKRIIVNEGYNFKFDLRGFNRGTWVPLSALFGLKFGSCQESGCI